MNLIRIALFNIRKKKGAAIALTILLILASLFLNLGVNITSNISNFFNNKSEELHGAHYVALFENNKYSPLYSQFFENDERVTETETKDIIYMESAEWKNEISSDDKILFTTLVENMDDNSKLSGYKIIEQSEDIKNDGVYLPMSLKGFGYKIGDKLKITFKNNDYSYNVAGFYEATIFGTRACGMFKIYLKNDLYNELYSKIGGAKLISARMKESYMADLVGKDFDRSVKSVITSTDSSQSIISATYNELSTASTITANMIAVFLIIFSIIITFICLLVIRFKIKNDIEENLINIGTLEALGFTSKEISRIYVFEFTMLAIVSSIVGTILSYVAIPIFSGSISNMVGVLWPNSIHILIDLICVLFICISVFLISYLCAASVKKYPPVVAFHGGIKSNSFKKNHFKLSRGNLNVNVKLALKRFAYDLGQNIVTVVIIASVTFATIFCTVLYTNFATDYKVLTRLAGFEMSSAEITITKNTDAEKLVNEIMKMDNVKKTNLLEFEKVNIDGLEINSQVCGDFSKLETLSVYEGRFPKYDNEVVITGLLGEELNKSIGDQVTLQRGGYSAKYIISGFMQTMSEGGKMSLLSIDVIKKIVPSYSPRVIQVYLNNNDNIEKFISDINNKYNGQKGNVKYNEVNKVAREKIESALKLYGVNEIQYAVMMNGKIIASGGSENYKIEKVQDMRSLIDSSLGPIISSIEGLSTIIVTATIIIIILILSLMIKTMIIKRKLEFGTLKAIGYTTRNLMFQIALSFMPAVILGSLIGTVIGYISVNPLLTSALHIAGISKFQASINITALLMVNILIVLFTFADAMFEAYKVRKISVYKLLTE